MIFFEDNFPEWNGGVNFKKKVTANGGLTVTSGQTLTLTGVTVTGLSAGLSSVVATSATAFRVGQTLANPALNIDTSTASSVTGVNIKSAASGNGVVVSIISSASAENADYEALGTGSFYINAIATGQVIVANSTGNPGMVLNGALIAQHGTAAINATATATAAQVATGYITSTSPAATTITLPTGTLLGAQLGAKQGTIHDLYIDNTAGANTVTIAVAVNGILSAAAAANGASQGLLTVPSGVTGQACFRLMFSSATAYTFTRIA